MGVAARPALPRTCATGALSRTGRVAVNSGARLHSHGPTRSLRCGRRLGTPLRSAKTDRSDVGVAPRESDSPSTSGSPGAKQAAPASSPITTDAVSGINYAERVKRLQALVAIRKIYRNLLRGQRWLSLPEGMYRAITPEEAVKMPEEDREQAEQERVETALDMISEMSVTGEQLRMMRGSLSRVPAAALFGNSQETLDKITSDVISVSDALAKRVEKEIALSKGNVDAEQVRGRVLSRLGLLGKGARSDSRVEGSPMKRLEKAEKEVERFMSTRVKPYMEQATDAPGTVVKEAASWARGVWVRLNGGGRANKPMAPRGLPMPGDTKDSMRQVLGDLGFEIEVLERELQEASKARETKLRSAGIESRARMAAEMSELDARVMALSRALAVRTLQLQLEYIYQAIEEEALDITPEAFWSDPEAPPARLGTSDEIALLVAEYELLADELGRLLPLAGKGGDKEVAFAAGAMGGGTDEELARLAQEVPDMRLRLGINDGLVFGGPGPLNLRRLQLGVKESLDKLGEGASFFSRGLRLMGNDLGAAGRLFMRAAMGGTLKPREVTALRRTARDMLSFVPFTIILVAPLTPVGHVLIFGFLQRYFPGFFPSQFSTRRQEIMVRYESLQRQLNEVQEQVIVEIQEREYKAAAAAVARLRDVSIDDGDDTHDETPSLKKLRQLEKEVKQAAEESELGDEV